MLTTSGRHLVRALFLIAVMAIPNAALCAAELDDVYQFIQNNAVNRTLSRQSEGTLAGDTVAYEFRRDMTICNLVRTTNRFSYDVIYVIKQRNWDLKDGKKIGDPRTEDRMLVERYEFGARKSTGDVIGFSQVITSTRRDWGGSTDTLQMKLEKGSLNVEISTARYDDFFAAGGTFYPGASVDKQTWSVRDGKLVVESRMTVYKVDSKTGKKELLKQKEPQEDKESAKLPSE